MQELNENTADKNIKRTYSKPLSRTQKIEAKRLSREGKYYIDIAQEIGATVHQVGNLLRKKRKAKKQRSQLRAVSRAFSNSFNLSDSQKEEIINKRKLGFSIADICKMTNISNYKVHGFLKLKDLSSRTLKPLALPDGYTVKDIYLTNNSQPEAKIENLHSDSAAFWRAKYKKALALLIEHDILEF